MTNMLPWQPPVLPDLLDWVESGFSGLPLLRGTHATHGIRIEQDVTENAYRVRAELPGLDPEKDVEISVDGGVLVLRAERREPGHNRHHSEFRYGSFARSVRLPAGAQTDKTSAEYKDGVLTVTVPLTAIRKGAVKAITVRRATSS